MDYQVLVFSLMSASERAWMMVIASSVVDPGEPQAEQSLV
jgi:hypothetical protein